MHGIQGATLDMTNRFQQVAAISVSQLVSFTHSVLMASLSPEIND
ncbi:UNVERIFIED_CONTAM: hypothetical protein ABIC26_001233 [Paenibacillus sp. PvR008]